MKTQKTIALFITLSLLLILVGSVSAAPAEKVDVCHFDKDSGTFFMINISDNAYDAHIAHGDAAPGEFVPNLPGDVVFNPDCSIPQKWFIEQVVVSGTSDTITESTQTLVAGQEYELEAIGKYKFANWATTTDSDLGWADAKYSKRTAYYSPTGIAGWIDGADLNGGDPALAFGLQVSLFDGDVIKPLTPLGWVEPYNDTHTYTAPYTGEGIPLKLFIYDNVYTDNSGSITVKIWQVNW